MTSDFAYVPERALVVAAHADDIEFGVSGTVARWTAGGAKVTYLIVTDSGSGNNEPDTDLDALRATRKEEQDASAAVVGVEDVRYLNHPDGVLEPTLDLRREITRVIRDVRPNAVITFDPNTIIAPGRAYVNHPDHRATGIAASYAVFPSAGSRPIFPELLDEGYEPHDVDRLYLMLTADVDHYMDITDYADKKREALACHRSQFGDDVIDMVLAWNREAGEKLNTGYVESMRLLNFRANDPDGDEE